MKKALMFGWLGVALLAQGGVYDDAIYWFRGGKTTGTGTAVQMFDEMHASDTSHANHSGAQFYGRPASRATRCTSGATMPAARVPPVPASGATTSRSSA